MPRWDPFPRVEPAPPNYDGFVASSANPRLLRQAKADYPEIARRSGLEGTVTVRVLVGPGGSVKEAVIAQGVIPSSTGRRSRPRGSAGSSPPASES